MTQSSTQNFIINNRILWSDFLLGVLSRVNSHDVPIYNSHGAPRSCHDKVAVNLPAEICTVKLLHSTAYTNTAYTNTAYTNTAYPNTLTQALGNNSVEQLNQATGSEFEESLET